VKNPEYLLFQPRLLSPSPPPCGELVKLAVADGLLINVTAERVVRLLPPLVINAEEVRELVARLAALIRAFVAKQAA
jgi:acetylornithine aminotransferase